MAHQLIKGRLPELCSSLMSLPPHKFWIHESVICDVLALPRGSAHGVSDVLSVLVQGIMKGGVGNSKRGTFESAKMDCAVDLFSEKNPSRLSVQKYGDTEAFQRGTLDESPIKRKPRWFLIGSESERGGVNVIIKNQQQAISELTGDAKGLPIDVQSRRRRYWKAFATGHECGPFLSSDIPQLAVRFRDTLWPELGIKITDGENVTRRSIDPVDLERVEVDLRYLLIMHYCIGRMIIDKGKFAILTSSKSRSRYTAAISPPPKPVRPHAAEDEDDRRLSSDAQKSKRTISRDGDELHDSLRLANLRCVKDGMIDVLKMKRLAIFELLFKLSYEDGFTIDAISSILRKRNIVLPDDFSLDDLANVSKLKSSKVTSFIRQSRSQLIEALHKFFWVPKDTDLLWDWLNEAVRFSSGRRVEAVNHEPHPSNDQPALTLEASYILMHIMFSFALTVNQVVALWANYYALIMRRPIPEEYLTSESSVWSNIMRICPIQERVKSQDFEARITKLTPLGFRRYFYSSSDDSEHWKKCRHVLIVTTVSEDGQPTFRHVASSVAFSKGSDANAKKNFEDMLLLLGIKILAHYGGGTNDNASDALLEIEKTFELVAAALADNGLEAELMINGVRRRAIIFGDPFHICNLVVNHFSKAAFGDPEKGDHEQTHWRQLLQSIHTLHSRDTALSQRVLDRVMTVSVASGERADFSDSEFENALAGEDPTGDSTNHLLMRSAADRDQRWLVNQRNARWVVENLRHETPDGTPALVAWAIEMSNTLTSDWHRRVGKEIAVWLSTPSVVFSLYAEAEVGEYYEESMAWHNRPGPYKKRCSFRIEEMHDIYFRFELPFWNRACNNLSSCLPKTMAYIERMFEGEEKEMRITQIRRGVIAGRNELIKMTTKNLLSCPIILLLLCDRREGPFFLRALLFVLYEAKAPDGVTLIQDVDSPNWGSFKYGENNLLMPSKEKRYYNILRRESDDVVHWWRQFCLNWPCLMHDLQRLSQIYVVEEKDTENASGLVLFRRDYPNLWECLDAVFGLFPSNSRLCEQIHGMMRKKLRIGTGQDESDKQRAYCTGTDFEMKQERREMMPTPKKGGKKARRDRHTKAQVCHESKQVLTRAQEFCAVARPMIKEKKVSTVRAVHNAGRRVKDKLLVGQQLKALWKKRSRSRREGLSLSTVLEVAETTRPSNDLILQSSDETLFLRKRLKEMTTQKFWDKMRANIEYKAMFGVALRCFRIPTDDGSLLGVSLLEHFTLEHGITKTKRNGAVVSKLNNLPKALQDQIARRPRGEGNVAARRAEMKSTLARFELSKAVKSKTAAVKVIGRCLNFVTKTFVREVDEFLYGVKEKGGEVEKRLRPIDKMDIANWLIRPRNEAWGEDEVNPSALLLVDAFQTIDPHYQYTKRELTTKIDDDDSEDEANETELVEEQYNAGVESGHIVGPD